MQVLGIDVGGSGIKGAVVDTETGELVTDRLRIDTPPSFKPGEIAATVQELVRALHYEGPIGVGFPAVVIDNRVITPPTSLAHKGWLDFPIAAEISQVTECPVCVKNDADVACLAEMRFGVGRDLQGVVMIFTLGTGIGTALFLNGQMVPNLEIGHIYLRGRKLDAEYQASDRVRKEKKLTWSEWGARLDEYFQHVERLFSPEHIIIGGGVSRKHKKFLKFIHTRANVIPAELRNEAGIIGAAMTAPMEQA